MKNRKLAALAVAAVLVVSGGTATAVATSASASDSRDTTCVPSPETTEVVVITPAIPATPGTPAIPAVPGTDPVYDTVVVTPAIEAQHYSLKGNSGLDKGEVPPTPDENPDIWQANTTQEPAGHLISTSGPDGGPYSGTGLHFASHGPEGEGKRDWFYFQPAIPEVTEQVLITPGTPGTPAVPAVPGTPEVPAVTETIVHPAVVCPETPTETPTTPTETPEVPTDEPTVTPEVPTETPTPEVPEEETPEEETPVKPPKSQPQPPKDVQVIACVDGVWTTQVNGETISESGSCVETPENTEFQTFSETGL